MANLSGFTWKQLKWTFYLSLLIENNIYFACLHYFKVSLKTLKPRVKQCDYRNQKSIRIKLPSKLHVTGSLFLFNHILMVRLLHDVTSYFVQSIWKTVVESHDEKIILIKFISCTRTFFSKYIDALSHLILEQTS